MGRGGVPPQMPDPVERFIAIVEGAHNEPIRSLRTFATAGAALQDRVRCRRNDRASGMTSPP